MLNPRFDRYFARAGKWGPEKRRLRAILAEFPLNEALKWRQPCYTYEGKNVVILHEWRHTCALGFFKGVLLDDPAGMLIAPGANSQASRQMQFRDLAQIEDRAHALRAVLASAIEVERAGLKVEFKARDQLQYPTELSQRLDAEPALAAAFEVLTPGRKRGYILHINGAKQAATRARRLEKHIPRILAGKGMHDP